MYNRLTTEIVKQSESQLTEKIAQYALDALYTVCTFRILFLAEIAFREKEPKK